MSDHEKDKLETDPPEEKKVRREKDRSLDREKGDRKSSASSRRRKHSSSDDDNGDGDNHSNSSSDDSRQRDRDRDRKRKRKRKKRKDSKSRSKSKSRSRREKDRSRGRRRKDKKKRRRRSSSSSSSSSSDSSSDSDSDRNETQNRTTQKKVVNQRLLQKLAERGETLEEREERRGQRRAARITAQFGYTAVDNPFNDPNIADTFTWNKKVERKPNGEQPEKKKDQTEIIHEIEKVRRRRRDYEEQKEEMERIRAEESRMKELENYDEWAKKEEEFHLQQQRQRSAIRLVEGREQPIDVLAKNMLMFGLSEGEKRDRAKVKYQEKYNAMEELENLEAELQEPHVVLKDLKLVELAELLKDIETFRMLERDVGGYENGDENNVLKYWDALHLVTRVEINELKKVDSASKVQLKKEIQTMFVGQSRPALLKMKDEVETKVKRCIEAGGRPVYDEKDGSLIDMPYWQTVLDELLIELSKMDLSEIHSKMLVCQLEQLEKKKEELARSKPNHENKDGEDDAEDSKAIANEEAGMAAAVPDNVDADFGNLEEELGLMDEIELGASNFLWQEKYRPRKPRYFNRVKTGYDWNKYNQMHYDHDNPPPKTVQGYKFNIFYPDLIDRTNTPQYFLEPTNSPEFCILRFHAGPPYEDVAFKIINREWNKSRKRGFKCTFERGVLSLYFNFKTHWYRK